MSNTFKGFGAKGFATGAAKKLFTDGAVPEGFVHMGTVGDTLKWGFWVTADGAAYIAPTEPEVHAPAASGNMFASIANTLGNTQQAPAPAARATVGGYKIEKDRPQQNGIKQPSTGTTCRTIWDTLDSMRAEAGAVPAIGAFKLVAARMGLDPTTTTIQYYRWRNYNGVSGRLAKEAPANAPA